MPSKVCQSLRRLRVSMLIALACVAGPAIGGDYPLVPGDIVRLQVADVEHFSAIAPVANDGFVSLPHFGRIRAEGRTVDDVRSSLQEMVGSIAFRVFDASRLPSVLEVAPGDVTLEIERRRDVAVLGSVASPGLLPFQPGLTVRSAVAAAGGIAHANPTQGGSDPSATAMRMAEINRLSRTRAETLVTIWRLETALGEDTPAPTAAGLGLDQEDADRLLALHREILAVGEQKQRETRELLDSLDLLFEKRAQHLEEQQNQQAEALRVDRQELERITDLKERGLTHLADRVDEMRRAANLSEVQLLQTQIELERVRIQRAQSGGERQRLNADQREADLAALAEARRALFDLESQISGMRNALALAATPPSSEANSALVVTEAVIHRGTGDRAIELRPGMDAVVEPGDAIEIVITVKGASDPAIPRPTSLAGTGLIP